jgi:outer membrane protein OmpA-like peptidoglycan-associated protein
VRTSPTITALVALGIGIVPLRGRSAEQFPHNPGAAQLIDALKSLEEPPSDTKSLERSPSSTMPTPQEIIESLERPSSTDYRRSDASRRMSRAAHRRMATLWVPFRAGSAAISPAAARVLDELAAALASPGLARFHFQIEDHTDTVGPPEPSRVLSVQRAANIVEYLVSRRGIDHARLTPLGMGQEALLVKTGPGVAEPRNRRVLVVNNGR